MKFEQVQKLQPQLVDRFQAILEQDRLSHAYLFTGDFGSFEMAQLLSQSLFCTDKKGVWPCGTCRPCRLIEEDEFSDVTVVRPVNQIIKTDRIRDLIQHFSQSGYEGSKQVFIICDADRMHVNAANSLLKVIEEPQSEVHIFLLTADEQLVLPTIKSRAQQVHFPKNQDFLKEYLLQEGLLLQQADLLANFSQGFQEAQILAQNPSFFDLARECERFVAACLKTDPHIYLLVSRLVQETDDKEKQAQAFRLLELLFARSIGQSLGRDYLEKLVLAKQMWERNVSFQNALEYMVLQLKNRR